MKTEPQTEQKLRTRAPLQKDPAPLWRKLFSSNWWWYGEINPDPATLPPPEKRPRFWRPHVWIVSVFWVVVLVFPLGSSYLNYEVPGLEQLQTLQGQVVAVGKRDPHIAIKLPSGEVVKADFPSAVLYLSGVNANRDYFDVPQREAVLACKDVEATGVYLRYVPFERFRIWSLQCRDASFRISFEYLQSRWVNHRKSRLTWDAFLALGGLLFFLIAYYIRERKDYVRNL